VYRFGLLLKPLCYFYQVGLDAGMIDLSLINATIYLLHAMNCGKLWELLEDVTMFDKHFNVKSMNFIAFHQIIFTLTDDGSQSTEFLKWVEFDTCLFEDKNTRLDREVRGCLAATQSCTTSMIMICCSQVF